MKEQIIKKAEAICKADFMQYTGYDEDAGLTFEDALTVIITHDSEDLEPAKVYDFIHSVVNAGKEPIEALSDRLSKSNIAMDSATDTMKENGWDDTDAYTELIGELAANEKLLITIEKLKQQEDEQQ